MMHGQRNIKLRKQLLRIEVFCDVTICQTANIYCHFEEE